MSARTGKPNGFRPSNPVDAFRISVGHSSMRFSNRGARAGVEACPYRTSLAIWNAFSGTNPLRRGGPLCPPVLADFSKRFSESLKLLVGAGISACPYGMAVIGTTGGSGCLPLLVSFLIRSIRLIRYIRWRFSLLEQCI